MKILSVVLILISFQAQANSFVSRCANPEATIVYAVDIMSSQLMVTRQVTGVAEKVQLTDFNMELLSSVELESSETTTCNSESKNGVVESSDLVFRKVNITLNDDQLFDKDIVGISEDQMSLPVDYLCRTTITKKITCPEK